jgi:hypothetical protein
MQMIEEFEKKNLLKEVYDLLESAQSSPEGDWWDALSEGHLARLEQSKSDFKAGKVWSHDQIKANAKQWLTE